MRTALPVCLFLISQTFVFGQVSSFEVIYNGISPNEPSPHTVNVDGNIGIKNPERGYSIRGGVFDIYSNTDFPNTPYYTDLEGDSDLGLDPLAAYYNWFLEDGISLVELEAYINYTDGIGNSQASLNSNHLSQASIEIPELLNDLGVKSHFILNSSFKYNQSASDGITNVLALDDNRYNKTLNYFDEATPVFQALNPYVAVAHLGWIASPWDFNQYRHSSNWKQSNYNIATNYAIGTTTYDSTLTNFHGTNRESVQRSDWGGPHNLGSVWYFQSAINHLKTDILNKTLDVFSDKKVLLKSTNAIAQYIGTSLNMSTPVYAVTYPTNFMDRTMSANSYSGTIPEGISNLQDEDKFLRIGYYENAFGGDTYSHYWSIGNAFTQHLQWGTDMPSYLGADWGNNPYYTDVHNLRKYRGNMWMHGEMPVYETEDPIINTTQNLNAYFTSSFNRNHQYFSNWYEGADGIPNTQYDYEIGEGISSGRLQDGLYSALKLKYFNFTSFNIAHNNLLDGRSPYEMSDGFDNSSDSGEVLVGNGIPDAQNTAIAGWKTKMLSASELTQFGMPVSNQYFKDVNGSEVDRSAYEYIRDHLGYRLELQSTQFDASSTNVNFETSIINRGFAAPQNKRDLYFVLMNEVNQLVKYIKSDADWRTWQPDEFSDGTTNANNLQFPLTNATYNSMDELIIGGIPLGEHGSDWHHSPITSYNPNTHTVAGGFNLNGLPDGLYKVGILLPDNDEDLSKDGRYAVRFANQAQFIPCTGVTVLGHITIGASSVPDNDGDGIANADDNKPNRPQSSDYFQFQLSNTDPCEEFLQSINLQDFEEKPIQQRLALSPNPVKNILSVDSKESWSEGYILTMSGQVVMHFDNSTNLVDVSRLNSGVFIVKLKGQKDAMIQRFVKKE